MIYMYIPVETGGSALILETMVFSAQEDIYFEVGITLTITL